MDGEPAAYKAVTAVTLLGVFFIPVALVCFLRRPAYLVPLLIVASLFEAGSLFNGAIGDFVFGVQPFYFVGVCIALRLLMLALQRGTLLPPRKDPGRSVAVLLLAFWAWSFASAFVMPHVFAGTPVYQPRAGLDVRFDDLIPLRWTLSNLAQAMYLTLNVTAVIYALHVVRTERQTEPLVKAFYWAIFIAVTVGLLQRFALWAHWHFPYEVINNNPGYYQGFDQEIGNFRRINSTFAEPSYAGAFLSAVGSGLLASFLTGRRGVRWLLALVAVLVVLLDTTATTGYAAFACMVCLLLVYFNPFAGKRRTQPSFGSGWAVILAVLGIAGAALLFIPGLSQAAMAMTAEKSEGLSFLHRLAADIYALMLFKDTYGLGVGLGSNRPSSLIMTFLSSVGIIGTALFATLLHRIIKSFPGRSAPASLQMTFWSLVALLVAQTIAVPDLNRPALWGLFLLVVAHLNLYSGSCTTTARGIQTTAARMRASFGGTSGVAPAPQVKCAVC